MHSKSTAVEYLCPTILGVTGHLMNNSHIIGRPGIVYDGIKQPCNLFIGIIGYSGTNKTTALSTVEHALAKVDPRAHNNCKFYGTMVNYSCLF